MVHCNKLGCSTVVLNYWQTVYGILLSYTQYLYKMVYDILLDIAKKPWVMMSI